MNLNSSNRLVRTRMLGGVAGAEPNGSPLCRSSKRSVFEIAKGYAKVNAFVGANTNIK